MAHWKHNATRCAVEGCERTRVKGWTTCSIIGHHSIGRTLYGLKPGEPRLINHDEKGSTMSDLYEKLLDEKRARIVKPTPTRPAYTQEVLAKLEAGLPTMTLDHIAVWIQRDWTKPYFGAVPYLDAMLQLRVPADVPLRAANYGLDGADNIVIYFLSNAQTWRGDVARLVKRELRRRV